MDFTGFKSILFSSSASSRLFLPLPLPLLSRHKEDRRKKSYTPPSHDCVRARRASTRNNISIQHLYTTSLYLMTELENAIRRQNPHRVMMAPLVANIPTAMFKRRNHKTTSQIPPTNLPVAIDLARSPPYEQYNDRRGGGLPSQRGAPPLRPPRTGLPSLPAEL